jgi:hypothetical protein
MLDYVMNPQKRFYAIDPEKLILRSDWASLTLVSGSTVERSNLICGVRRTFQRLHCK